MSLRYARSRILLFTSVVIHPFRKIPLPPAFSVRLRDDILMESSGEKTGEGELSSTK